MTQIMSTPIPQEPETALLQTGNDTDEPLGEEYEVDIVYPREHNGSGFCWDETCPDREDQDNIQTLGQAVTDGLVTSQEADKIYHGKTV